MYIYTYIHLKLCRWEKKLCSYVLRVYDPHLSAKLKHKQKQVIHDGHITKPLSAKLFFSVMLKGIQPRCEHGCFVLTNRDHNGGMGMSCITPGTCNTESEFVKCLESQRG